VTTAQAVTAGALAACPRGHDLTVPGRVLEAEVDCSCCWQGHHLVRLCRACPSEGYDTAWYDPPHAAAWEPAAPPVTVTGPWRVTCWRTGPVTSVSRTAGLFLQ
jgi:hypothetical protein